MAPWTRVRQQYRRSVEGGQKCVMPTHPRHCLFVRLSSAPDDRVARHFYVSRTRFYIRGRIPRGPRDKAQPPRRQGCREQSVTCGYVQSVGACLMSIVHLPTGVDPFTFGEHKHLHGTPAHGCSFPGLFRRKGIMTVNHGRIRKALNMNISELQ